MMHYLPLIALIVAACGIYGFYLWVALIAGPRWSKQD